jgi:hypothetical protein
VRITLEAAPLRAYAKPDAEPQVHHRHREL